MLFIFRLLALPVTGPVHGFRFILEQIRQQALAEMLSEEEIRSLMIEASMQNEAGELSDEEYEEFESQLLEQLNTIRRLNRPVEDDIEYLEDEPANEQEEYPDR